MRHRQQFGRALRKIDVSPRTTAYFGAVFKQDGALPTVMQGIEHDHGSLIRHINSSDETPIGKQMLAFIESR